jgi:hypothetical protein
MTDPMPDEIWISGDPDNDNFIKGTWALKRFSGNPLKNDSSYGTKYLRADRVSPAVQGAIEALEYFYDYGYDRGKCYKALALLKQEKGE